MERHTDQFVPWSSKTSVCLTDTLWCGSSKDFNSTQNYLRYFRLSSYPNEVADEVSIEALSFDKLSCEITSELPHAIAGSPAGRRKERGSSRRKRAHMKNA
jgi:hypothetical protein